MPLKSTYRTILRVLTQPHIVRRARESICLPSLLAIKSRSRFHYLRVTKRNINYKNKSSKLREKIYSHHYQKLDKVFDKGCIDLFVEHGAVLWRCTSSPQLTIVLKQGNEEFRDGEIELQFKDGSKVIYFMGFTLVPENSIFKSNYESLLITRVQGSPGYLDDFKNFKYAVNDVAINHLLFAALRGLAAYMGIHHIYGVATRFQSYYEPVRLERFSKCYDQFWESLLGIKVSEYFYSIQVPYIDKNINLVSQHHRSRTRKKRDFKNDVIRSVFLNIKDLNPYAANRISNSWFTPHYQLDSKILIEMR